MQTIAQQQRNLLVGAGRALNTTLDFVFYDVSALTADEKAGLSASANPEGSILIVPPQADNREITKLTSLEFISAQRETDANAIDTIVVAGVGSSALGTAALARNVADSINRPVAGVVSGFGLADVLSEALGGWFVLGFKNSIRDGFAKMFDALEMKDHVWDDDSYRSLVKDKNIDDFVMDRFVFGSPDSLALLLTLYHLRTKIKLLVGHSKGNYVIENALEGLASLCTLKKQDIPRDLQVVTLGAVVRFPEQFSEVTQFIGGVDWFGMMNSRRELERQKISGSWHSLNTRLLGHLSVEEALRLAGVQ
ncbi:MAG: hypothetical protein QNJ61_13515 [Desulfobacterales bacterium]|nr:hypothetical protein [Desulfobacterales bacterium]